MIHVRLTTQIREEHDSPFPIGGDDADGLTAWLHLHHSVRPWR